MAGQTAKQYDFERFQPRTQTPSVRVVPGKKKKADRYADKMKWMSRVSVGAVLLAMTCSLLYSQAQVTELTGDIQAHERQLEAAKSTYNYLSGQLDQRSSLNNLESQAQALGLMKLEKNQLTYVTLETQSRIELPESNSQKMITGLSAKIMYLMGNAGF